MSRMTVLGAVVVTVLLVAGCAGEPIPEELGWYVVDGGGLKPLPSSSTVVASGLAVGNKAYGLKEISDVNVTDPNAYFIVYATNAPSIMEKITLSRFGWEASREMTTFMNTTTNVPLQLYTPTDPVPMGIVPMKQDDRMFRLVPKEPLTIGPYGLHLGEMAGLGSPRVEIHDFFAIDPIDSRSYEEWCTGPPNV